jgi:hypothetical protein
MASRHPPEPGRAGILFFDITVSGLDERGFPVEIGWVGVDGAGNSVLIRPQRHWTYWSCKAEQMHRISREMLASAGMPAAEAAQLVADTIRDRIVYTGAPEWDRHWLRMLLAEGDAWPDYALRGTDHAMFLALAPLAKAFPLQGGDAARRAQEKRLARIGRAILARARDHADRVAPRTHRAFANAFSDWTMWREIGRLVSRITA